jgi:hypothetical protein
MRTRVVVAFPLLFVGLSALAGSVRHGPVDGARPIGLIFACVLLTAAALLLADAARAVRLPLWLIVPCAAVAALPVIAALDDGYVNPSAVLLLVSALALEVGLLTVLAGRRT